MPVAGFGLGVCQCLKSVDLIYEFKDDRFAKAIAEIALNRSKYRKYDDGNESTLRKCVHAFYLCSYPHNASSTNVVLHFDYENRASYIDFSSVVS